MKTNSLRYSLILIAPLLSSCLSGFNTFSVFQAVSFQDQNSTAPATANENDPQSAQPLKLKHLVSVHTTSILPGWLTEQSFTQYTDATQTFEAKLKIPYYWILEAAKFAVDVAFPFSCRLTPWDFEQNPFKYNKGEIPCGVIQPDGRKILTHVEVDRISTRSGSFRGTIEAFNIPVMLGREQFSGTYQESRLDSRTVESLISSREAGKDISFRYRPNDSGTGARFEVCLNMPGVEISSADKIVRAKAKAYLGFFRPGYAGDFRVNLGRARFDYLRGCFATDISFNSKTLLPELQFVATQTPFGANGRHSGFSVRAQDWWLRLFDRIFDWFKFSIRRQAAKIAHREANKYIDRQIETGKWFERIKGQEILNKTAQTVNKSIVKAFHGSLLPLRVSDLRYYLKRQCQLLRLVKEIEGVQVNTQELCERTLDKVHVALLPFFRDPALTQQGCYDHFANIHETRSQGRPKPWARNCGISMKAQIRFTNPLTREELSALDEVIGSIDNLASRLERAIQSLGNLKDLIRGNLNLQDAQNIASLILVLNQINQRGLPVNSLQQFLSLVGPNQDQTVQNILNYVL